MIVELLVFSFVYTTEGCLDGNKTIPEVNPCANVLCVQGWCEAFFKSAICRCKDGFWGYLCEHEGDSSGSLFWDYLPLQEQAYLTGHIDSEEEAVHPLCQIGSFSDRDRRRALFRQRQAKRNKGSLWGRALNEELIGKNHIS